MKINQKIRSYQLFAKLIEIESTGSSSEFSKKIGVSRATLFNMLEESRALGVFIEYDDKNKTYYYSSTSKLIVSKPIQIASL